MSLDENLISHLAQDTTNHEFHLHYQDKVYSLEDVTIIKSPMPVNKPTTRGDVYSISDEEYKVKGTIHDLSIVPLISKMMLGPNTEFQEIPVKTHMKIDGKSRSITFFTYLTNTMNNSSKIIFNLLIVRMKIQ